jgi:hypothetical protein
MRRYYPGITIFKLVGSLLVLLDHGLFYIYIVEMPNQQMRFVINIFSVIVPCFYVIAGFLAYKGWSNAKSPRLYVRKYLTWILVVYGFFCLMFIVEYILPELINKGLTFNNLFFQAKILLMTIILNGPYMQFWFIPPLIFGILVSYWFYEKGLPRLAFIVALLGFLISQFTSGTLRGIFDLITGRITFLIPRYVEYFATFIKGYFGNGFIFVLVGVILAKHEERFFQLKVWTILIPAIILTNLETIFLFRFVEWSIEYALAFSVLPNTILLFYCVLHIKSQAVQIFHKAINLFSIITYFCHILFIKMNLFILNWNLSSMNKFQLFIYLFLTLVECVALTYLLTYREKRNATKKERYLSS